MGLTASAFANLLADLLPPGQAFEHSSDSVLRGLLEALGEEPARVAARVVDFLREVDPLATAELLAEWEELLGLPDPCLTTDPTLAERKEAVAAKIGAIGSQTPAFFVALAASLGHDATVVEYRPTDCATGTCLSPVRSAAWIHHWSLDTPGNLVELADCVSSTCVDPLASWGNEALVCAVARAKPAHTVVSFIDSAA